MQSDREAAVIQRAISDLARGVEVEASARVVFAHYYPWVRRFFSRFGYLPQDCEDLAQDVFSQVFRHLGSYRGDSPFESWLFAVAANVQRNERRRRMRDKRSSPEVSLEEAREGSGDAAPWEPSARDTPPPVALFERERREALDAAIQHLPPQMRQVLRLRLGRDLALREIAVVLAISVETVKSHLFQARKRLRDDLGDAFGAWPEGDFD